MEQGIRIRTVVLLLLLLSGVSFTNAQQISTIGEIYDFDVGDIFHFRFWASSPYNGASSITNITIVNKLYSLNNDTVVYERAIAYQETYPNPTIEYYLDEAYYTNLDSHINMGFIDTVYSNPSFYNGRVINGVSDGDWHFDYVEGCGQANVFYNDGVSVFSEDELVYYKKGNEEWGNAISVSVDELIDIQYIAIVYPNPFTTTTTIEYELTESTHVNLTIYSSMGQAIEEAFDEVLTPGSHSFTWTPEGLPQGLYYAVLRSEEGVSVIKMLKQ